jgi:hypothetical protein
MRKLLKLVVVFIAVSRTAQAASFAGLETGLLLGWVKPSVSGGSGSLTDGRISLGIEANYPILSGFAAGAYFLTGKSENSVTVASTTFTQSTRYTPFGAQASYKIAGTNFAAGIRLGMTSVSTSTTGSADTSSTSLTYGPYGTYDYPVFGTVSLGADVSLLSVRSSPDSTTLINLLAAAKYRF